MRRKTVSIDGSVKQSSFGLLGGRLALLQPHLHSLESAPLHLGVDDPGVGGEGVGDLLRVFRILVVLQGRDGRATEDWTMVDYQLLSIMMNPITD